MFFERQLEDLSLYSVFDQHKFELIAVSVSPSGNLCCSEDTKGSILVYQISRQLNKKQISLIQYLSNIMMYLEGQQQIVVGQEMVRDEQYLEKVKLIFGEQYYQRLEVVQELVEFLKVQMLVQ